MRGEEEKKRAHIAWDLACVAIVSVWFRSKDKGTTKNGIVGLCRAKNGTGAKIWLSFLVVCSKSALKRFLRRLHWAETSYLFPPKAIKVDGTVMTREDVWTYVLDPEAKTPHDLIWREYYNPVSQWLAVWKTIISLSFSPLPFFLSAMLDC